jgi:hypothetical protein
MAVLDVRFSRGSLTLGRSSSFDADEDLLLNTLRAFARSLCEEAGEPKAPLAGTVRKPLPKTYLERLSREADACEAQGFVRVACGQALAVPDSSPLLVVVLAGRGELDTGESRHALAPGSVALLPASTSGALSSEPDLELLAFPVF